MMKQMSLAMVAVMLVSSPAFALRITNLDKIPQTVELAGAGEPDRRTIQPGDTEYFVGNSTGRLSLIDPSAPHGKRPRDNSTLHADGLLSGIVGAARTTDIPADPDTDYVIWPGGRLQVQHKTHNGGKYF